MFPTFHTYFYAEFSHTWTLTRDTGGGFFGLKNQKTYFLFSISFCRFISFSSPFSPPHTTPQHLEERLWKKFPFSKCCFAAGNFFLRKSPNHPCRHNLSVTSPGCKSEYDVSVLIVSVRVCVKNICKAYGLHVYNTPTPTPTLKQWSFLKSDKDNGNRAWKWVLSLLGSFLND